MQIPVSNSQIAKTATRPDAFRRPSRYFDSAREAFKTFLREAEVAPGQSVLLPAYIGWSPREGSGVFDPVAQLGLDAAFYRVDERLRVDLGDLRARLAGGTVRVVVLIHYFGYVDPSYRQAAELAREAGALVLEDEAHAMLTDIVGGGCGRLGDACIFSLHKMLPTSTGGMLIHNEPLSPGSPGGEAQGGFSPWDYDLFAIAAKRRRNAERLSTLLRSRPIAGIEPLWPDLKPFEVPQTYPVLIHDVSRFALYNEMNEAGYGVVSLYHTLIDKLPAETFPASHAVAGKILNLPVHQDIEEVDLERLVAALDDATQRLRG